MKDLLHHAQTACTAIGAGAVATTVFLLAWAYLSDLREKRWRKRHAAFIRLERRQVEQLERDFNYSGGFRHGSGN